MGARTCSQNDFRKNRRLLVDSTSWAGIKSNGLRGPRCKPSLQFCIPFDTILVRPYKLSHDERRTVMAGKVLGGKKHPRIYAQTEKFYEEIRKEQQKNISGPSAALLGLIRDTVKRLDTVIGELNDLRNAVGMSEIFLLANAGVYDRALQSQGGKARTAKPSPAQRTEIGKKAVAARWKEKGGK